MLALTNNLVNKKADYLICQSIGFRLFDIKKSLALENGLEPKKPL